MLVAATYIPVQDAPMVMVQVERTTEQAGRGQKARPDPVIPQANANQQTATQREHVLGVCELLNLMGSGQADIFPVFAANSYFKSPDEKINPGTAIITVLNQPKHGRVEPTNSDGNWSDTRYLPNNGYLGNDSFVIQVEGNGYKVKLNYFIAVAADDTVSAFVLNPACKGVQWKISQDVNGTPTLIAVNYQSRVTDAATIVP